LVTQQAMRIAESLKQRDIRLALLLQLFLSIFLAHGYDFRVSYVAGRNIVEGLSPYFGGTASGWLAEGYGPEVQGIGETPLWALYLGLSYFLSAGQPFLFNFITKLPIFGANIALAYLVHSKGCKGWRFYLVNAFLILTTVTWGKPDNLATYLAVLSLTATESAVGSALLLSTSIMIKPLAVAILPAFFSRLRSKSKSWSVKFVVSAFGVSGMLFITPFLALGWPFETVTSGFVNWFEPAGALSPFNVLEIFYGIFALPSYWRWVGYLAPVAILILTAYGFFRPAKDTLRLGLLSASVFFTLRPWTSEQNLVIALTLFILINGEITSKRLWAVPLLFAFANNSLQQQLFLLWPGIVSTLDLLYRPVNIYRLWLKFILASAWLLTLWTNVRHTFRSAKISTLPSAG